MPSPFPGMDPYLEGELWSSFHAEFAVTIAHALNPLLTPRYIALPEKYQETVAPQEIGIAFESEARYPDVAVARTEDKKRKALEAAAVLAAPLMLDTVVAIPVNHSWIKIIDRRNRRLVTAIEFMSPANKHGHGRKKYLRRRTSFLMSSAHLMEIDLLRSGQRVPMVAPLPEAAYFVFLCRSGQRPATQIWPVALDKPLPAVPVPLLPGDTDISLDLQRVFTQVYDLGAFQYVIDYREDPEVTLSPDWASWCDHQLREAGKRRRARRSK